MTDWMAQLCAQVGVHSRYRGFDGQNIDVPPQTQLAVLRALGIDVESEVDARDFLERSRAKEAARPLPSEVIIEADKPSTMQLAHPVEWTVYCEGTDAVLGSGKTAANLLLPALPMGIHRMELVTGTDVHTTWVLSRPARAIQLSDHIPNPRIWGVLAALYGLTDGGKAQIGSYDILGDYAAVLAGKGADFLGINPVHAMGGVLHDGVISPYSPSHRGFLNTWHCAVHRSAEGLNSTLVDYPSALNHTARMLADQYTAFCALDNDAPEKQSFQAFEDQAGTPLDEFALFEALSKSLGADWRDWPTMYRDHDEGALVKFASENTREIAFTKWTQWQADAQLTQAQAAAKTAGMRVGLYLDLAVGPRLGGAETWVKDTSLITGATLGAPPDPLGPQGQSWGLAPQSPLKLRADGYAGFARLLGSIMRHSGMIRIDHVLGLMRSFWIPQGHAEGTYVSYPIDALLAVVAIESVRNNTIVVGEDLGLVPEGLREKLAASGIYGLDVLQYMRSTTGGFVDTSKTRQLAVCTFATHDTPTVAGFFAAEDARVRHELGGIDAATLAQTRADRASAKETLATSDPVTEIHRQLARANAGMVAIQLDDIARQTSQQNLPGTVDTYPNWRLKSPFSLDELATSETLAELAIDMAAQDRSNSEGMEKTDAVHDCSNHAH